MHRSGAAAAQPFFERAIQLKPDLNSAAIDLAGVYRLEGKFDQARAVLDKAVARDPKNFDAMMARASLERAHGSAKAEIAWLERARTTLPSAAEPRLRLIDAYIAAKDTRKALEVANELAQITDQAPQALAALGEAELANKQPQSAVNTLRQLVAMTKDAPLPLVQLSRAYAAAGDPENARAALRTALVQDSGNVIVHGAIVQYALSAKQIDYFLGVARDLGRDRPKEPGIDELEGVLLLNQRHAPEAIAAFTKAIAKGAGRRSVIGLSQAQLLKGDAPASIATLNDWLDRNPGDREVRTALARMLGAVGRLDAAIAEDEKLAAQSPTDALLLNDLAWLYQQKGDARAVETAQTAHDLAPSVPTVADTYGWILVQHGEVEKGLKLLQQVAGKPGDATPAVKYHLAVALDRSGRGGEARKLLDDALASGMAFAEANDAKALRARLGN
jgi:putative PEP-CTERM system TPR-repeat lipoprotein